MKKSILLFAAALGMLTACEPIKEDGSLDVTNITADQLLANATFKQYAQQVDEDGNITYVEAEDGNYISYNVPGVSGLIIYTLTADGTEQQLQQTAGDFLGAGSGMFQLIPRRGSDPNQTVYFRYINQAGETVEASKAFSVYVPGDIAYELKLLCSNDYGEKTWTWDPSITGVVWGNMGYCGGAGSAVGISGNGQWWGIIANDDEGGAGFNQQLQHSEGGVNHGDGDMNAYMVFNEDGTLVSYDKDGNEVRRGTFKVENYDASDPDAWKVGDLRTYALLWPWVINTDAKKPSEVSWGTGAYEIVYLTPDKMTLVYPGVDGEGNANALGGWGEATFWHFKSSSDQIGMTAGYDKGKEWTWDTSITGVVWGNMGYQPGTGESVGISGNGQWWGIIANDDEGGSGFNQQLQHSEGGVNHGDGDLDAYMTFGTDGLLTSYDKDGNAVRSGIFEFVPVKGSDWKVADLKTDAILWPWVINTNAKKPSEVNWGGNAYEVVYLTNDKMTLVYPGGNAETGEANGSWGEATFWHFKAK